MGPDLPTGIAWTYAAGAEPTTADILTPYLREHLSKLEAQVALLRAGDPDGVHQLRVAARRLRSALGTYASVLAVDTTTALRSELRWLGRAAAGARDAQVLLAGLHELLATQPTEVDLAPLAARIDHELSGRLRDGFARAEAALDSERHRRLVDRLEAFVVTPPLDEHATRPARQTVPVLLEIDLARVHARHRAYTEEVASDRRDHALHEVRKAAKRLRYGAETATPAFGSRATMLARRAAGLQELLGEHQDSVIAVRALRDIGSRGDLTGEHAATFVLLQERATHRAAEVERDYPRVFARLPGSDLTEWLGR